MPNQTIQHTTTKVPYPGTGAIGANQSLGAADWNAPHAILAPGTGMQITSDNGSPPTFTFTAASAGSNPYTIGSMGLSEVNPIPDDPGHSGTGTLHDAFRLRATITSTGTALELIPNGYPAASHDISTAEIRLHRTDVVADPTTWGYWQMKAVRPGPGDNPLTNAPEFEFDFHFSGAGEGVAVPFHWNYQDARIWSIETDYTIRWSILNLTSVGRTLDVFGTVGKTVDASPVIQLTAAEPTNGARAGGFILGSDTAQQAMLYTNNAQDISVRAAIPNTRSRFRVVPNGVFADGAINANFDLFEHDYPGGAAPFRLVRLNSLFNQSFQLQVVNSGYSSYLPLIFYNNNTEIFRMTPEATLTVNSAGSNGFPTLRTFQTTGGYTWATEVKDVSQGHAYIGWQLGFNSAYNMRLGIDAQFSNAIRWEVNNGTTLMTAAQDGTNVRFPSGTVSAGSGFQTNDTTRGVTTPLLFYATSMVVNLNGQSMDWLGGGAPVFVGARPMLRWDSAGNLVINSNNSASADLYLNFDSARNTIFGGNAGANVRPQNDNAVDLGIPTNRWRNAFFVGTVSVGTIYSTTTPSAILNTIDTVEAAELVFRTRNASGVATDRWHFGTGSLYPTTNSMELGLNNGTNTWRNAYITTAVSVGAAFFIFDSAAGQTKIVTSHVDLFFGVNGSLGNSLGYEKFGNRNSFHPGGDDGQIDLGISSNRFNNAIFAGVVSSGSSVATTTMSAGGGFQTNANPIGNVGGAAVVTATSVGGQRDKMRITINGVTRFIALYDS